MNPQQSPTEMNANATPSAIDNLATQTANQLFISQQQQPQQPSSTTQSASDIYPVQTNVIQPPSVIPSAYQQPPSNIADVNQQFVQNEGELTFFLFLKQ